MSATLVDERGQEMKTSGGGAAAAGGMEFQHRVAAWVAAHILAEKDTAAPWELPADTTLEWLRCETEQPVDDLLVGTSANGLLFAQVKRTLQLASAPNSQLASALDQFVRQFISNPSRTTSRQLRDRPLDPARDRLVLVTSRTSSKPILVHLPAVLSRLRSTEQTLDRVPRNQKERKALSILQTHLTRSWRKSLGTLPSEGELKQLLSLIYIQVADLAKGGTEEREARSLLRTSILRNPENAKTAWALLVSLCGSLAAEQSGASRVGLQTALLNVGLQLRTPWSYKDDIQSLREYSRETLDRSADLARIRVETNEIIKIQRPSTRALRNAAEEASILVVGEPGAGKSGALHDLVEALSESERDHVFLAVDRLAACILADLHGELGLKTSFVQVLKNWPGNTPAFLVIDALDAARGGPAVMMIRDLIRQVVAKNSRWRVVASIRKFDLRYGEETKKLFAGTPPTRFQDVEFGKIRHLNVPRLSDDELDQISSQSPRLRTLTDKAPKELEDLLRVPFNLRLLAALLGIGIAAEELTPIRTQLELLDRYWKERVLGLDRQGDARESVLRKVCEEMVKSRELRVDRSAVAESGSSDHLTDVLSSQVLSEWQYSVDVTPNRYVLAFSHHVLFDYGVARLLLRGIPEAVVRWFDNDSDMVIVVRPSLLMHFQHLWTVDASRKCFWDFVFRVILAEKVPEIGKLIGPSVAAELAQGLEDLDPLCTSLDQFDSEIQPVAEQALSHLIGARLAGIPSDMPVVGPNASLWCLLLERVSRRLRRAVAYKVRPLLSTICSHSEDLTSEQRVAVGLTARRLLEFAWAQSPIDNWLVAVALETLCRTFESDSSASAALIRSCLETEHLKQYGFDEMPRLAGEVKRLIDFDPALVEEIYRVAFQHKESSTDPTPLGAGNIVPINSNRQQDYGLALHYLAEAFSAFLRRASANATRALIDVLEAYVAQRHHSASGERHEETFAFHDREVCLQADYSGIWDEDGIYSHDEAVEMLDAFQRYLEELAKEPEGTEVLSEIVELLIARNRLAILWRRVLQVGASQPGTLGEYILPFAWAIPVLTCFDTTTQAGEFLREVFPTLGRSKRKRIEQAILSIPSAAPASLRVENEQMRNRLLGCLTKPVTEEAQRILNDLNAGNDVPANEPQARVCVQSVPYGAEEHLRKQGVPVEAEPNRKIRDFEQPVKEFADAHSNSTPTLDEVSIVLPSLQALHETLSSTDAAHPKQCDHAWGCLAASCARIARNDRIACNEPAGSFVKSILVEASRHSEPKDYPPYGAQFDENPYWEGQLPRVEAAMGLIFVANNPSCVNPEVLDAIERLSSDSVPAVRFQIATGLNALYQTAPDLMWQLIERMSREEPSRGVLLGLVSGPLQKLAVADPNRIAGLTVRILNRVRIGSGAKRLREFIVGLLADLYIWRDQIECREVITKISMSPAAYPDEAPCLLARLWKPVTHGPTDRPEPLHEAIRHRALQILDALANSAVDVLREIEQRYLGTPVGDWPSQELESAKSLLRIVNQIGKLVYSVSGTRDKKSAPDQPDVTDQRVKQKRAERFYIEVRPILDKLSRVGSVRLTHLLLESLESFTPFDPRGVFLFTGRFVRVGQKRGYQHEALAADLIVRLVERYLAEYRALLREDEDCRQTLMELLDVFVEAGWPAARRLTYRLEEIFR